MEVGGVSGGGSGGTDGLSDEQKDSMALSTLLETRVQQAEQTSAGIKAAKQAGAAMDEALFGEGGTAPKGADAGPGKGEKVDMQA